MESISHLGVKKLPIGNPKGKVQVAIARIMLTAIWFILHDNVPYRDYTPDIVAE